MTPLVYIWVGWALICMLGWLILDLHRRWEQRPTEHQRKMKAVRSHFSMITGQELMIHHCDFGHVKGISTGYCTTCTAERELRATNFEMFTACPQCGEVENHHWERLTVLGDASEFGEPMVIVEPAKIGIVRRCANCKYEWKQS